LKSAGCCGCALASVAHDKTTNAAATDLTVIFMDIDPSILIRQRDIFRR
jgi:hypothetical protein